MNKLYLLLCKIKYLLLQLKIEGKSLADQQRLSKSANIEKLSQVRAILRLMG